MKELLRKHSLIFGDFTLSSGKKSRYYFDSKKTTLLAEGAYLAAVEVLELLRARAIRADAIGGLTLGADPIVCPVAALSQLDGRPLRAFIVRKEAKEHGTGRRIEGSLEPGSRVVVVDDVVTTAASTLKAIEAVEAEGHTVVAVVCIVDREEGGTEKLAGWPFYPIFKRSEIFSPPDGESLDDPEGQ
ncbi:MAG TPA: orotate phosphoribosyltransferase [Candidatus Polarisedimenticolaceae bacterium]|nr:orotate phosphoribosyltransferase [Candidatus Polarisedimenticolaceae bacterium]